MAEQQMLQEQIGKQTQQHQDEEGRHYFDSIETDKFEMPTVFPVDILLADNQRKTVQVEVEKCTKQKPYLGGFKNNKNGLVYYHAFTQTDQNASYHPDKNERTVQTYQYKTKSTVMMREFGTQMEKPDLYIDTRKDKIIYPKPYFSSEMWKKQRDETTLYI